MVVWGGKRVWDLRIDCGNLEKVRACRYVGYTVYATFVTKW